MNTIASTLLFILLAGASASTIATDGKAEAADVRTETPASRSDTAPAATPVPSSVKHRTAPETRKQKRCRQYHKTVGIACRKPASR